MRPSSRRALAGSPSRDPPAARACLVLLLSLALATPGPAQRSDVPSAAYEAVIRLYLSGGREAAVAEMSGWPDSRVREEMRALNALLQKQDCAECTAKGLWQRFPVRAALMLHSDCAQRARRDGKAPRLQESAASSIARILKNDPSHRSFARRWYGAMAGLAQSENRWGDALDWVKQGLKDFPGAADLLLVLGSIDEIQGALLAPGVSDDAAPGTIAAEFSRREVEGRDTRARHLAARGDRERLEEARGAFRSALGADPSLSEARLRLGRVAWRLGATAEARSQLETVLAGKPEAATAFLAHLFLGRLDEDAGRLDEAAQAYEKALEIDPRCQSARLGLSHVRFRQGDAVAARAEAETALAAAGQRIRSDAFWLYPWGLSIGVEGRLEALRREASSP